MELDHHISFMPRVESLDLDTDFVIVGSGAGGASAALTLARAGHHVTVVEAGAWRDPDDYPHSAYGAMRDMMEKWGSLVTRGRAFWPVAQGHGVGGSTVINSAICVRTPADIFRDWKEQFGFGGDELGRAIWRIQDELERELHAVPVPAASLGRSNELAVLGARRTALDSHVMTRYAKDCLGSGQCLQGCKAKRKQSLNLTFIPEVIARGGRVLSCAPVQRVMMRGQKAIGVEGRFVHPLLRTHGGPFRIRARRAVLVGASVTHTAPLLRRSGVRLPALGKNFRTHPGTPVFGLYDDKVDMSRGATQGWASTAYRTEPGFKLETLSLPLDLFAGRLSGGGRTLMDRLGDYSHMAMWVQACRAEGVGTVSTGIFGEPVIRYDATKRDMENVRSAMHVVAKLHFAAGARAVIPQIHGLPYSLKPGEEHLIAQGPLDPRSYVAIVSHLFGGAVMGRDPASSVVDDRGRVHGHPNLLVVDASIIPSTLGVNPQHTIMALARHIAEHLA